MSSSLLEQVVGESVRLVWISRLIKRRRYHNALCGFFFVPQRLTFSDRTMLIQYNALLLLLLIISTISSSRLSEKFKTKIQDKIQEKCKCQLLTCVSIDFSLIFKAKQSQSEYKEKKIVDLELYTRQTPYVLRLATMHFQSQLSLKMMVKREVFVSIDV